MATFSLKAFLKEARRRRVFRVTAIYIVGAWVALQAADLAFPGLGIEESAILYVWIGAIMGLPIVLFFGWRYDIIGGRIVRTAVSDVDANLSMERTDYVILAALSVVIAVVVFGLIGEISKTRVPDAPRSAFVDIDPRSIAVLPFLNMSDDPEQEYFSDGISEEILNLLAKIPELRVTSRSSAFSFKGQNLDVPTMAAKLNVAHVLEGSVRKSGNQLRITAQLIKVESDTHLWSESYDRELENIFALQDEISAAIVAALKEHLGLQVEFAPRVIAAANTEAHDAYLRGRYLVVQRNRDTVEGAVREFEKAISHDPEYALAHAELAIAYLLMRRIGYGVLTEAEGLARAAPHAKRALDLDPTLGEAHAAAGMISWTHGNLDEALTHFEQAIQINPSYSIVHNWTGGILGDFLGRYAESFAAYEMALRVDPLSIPATENYILALIERDRLAEAERELQKLASIAPGHYALFRGALTSRNGKWANAVLAQLDALRINPESVPPKRLLSRYFATIGLDKEALAISEAGRSYVLSILGRPEYRESIGDYARARPILEEMWQQSGGRVTRGGFFQIDGAAALIAIRRDAGEEAEVDELLTAIRDNVHRYREAGITAVGIASGMDLIYSVDYEEGVAAYLAGEGERGLALIAKAVEDGYFILPNEAYLQVLYDDPGFAAIRASQEARQARERNKFLDIVCTDNPYEAVWQPAEGTCERFAAAGEN